MQRIGAFSRSFDKGIIKGGECLSWVYLFIVGISVYEVFMRYVFHRPTTWVHETSIALAGVCMIYGGLYAYAKDKHISITILTDVMSTVWQRVFILFSDVVGLCYIAILTIASVFMAKQAVFAPDGSIRLERSGSSWNPPLPGLVKIIMTIFLILFALQLIIHVITRSVTLYHMIREEASTHVSRDAVKK